MPLDGIQAEQLAYWYFRLNGYFTIRDFVVHPDLGSGQQTDIDVFGVRFPFRSELLKNSMQDDELLVEDKIHIVMVEVKAGQCSLNNSWKNKEAHNVERFLNAIGALPETMIESAATELYEKAAYEDDKYSIQIIVVGSEWNDKLFESYSEIDQITYKHMLEFIFERFSKYHLQKKIHPQWDEFGEELWQNYNTSQDVEEFIQKYLS